MPAGRIYRSGEFRFVAASIARMQSPTGWQEPWQTPKFDEYTVVLRGMLRVETRLKVLDVQAGHAVITVRGE
jgi:quercetin dioxygenase-like cupin family protein